MGSETAIRRARPKVIHYLEMLRDEIGFDKMQSGGHKSAYRQKDRSLLRLPASASRPQSCRWTIRKTRTILEDFIRAHRCGARYVPHSATNAAADM